MAVAAETIQADFNWQAAEAQFLPYQLVDEIPIIAENREAERLAAWTTLQERRRTKESVTSEAAMPLPIDALSTAQHVLSAGQAHGEASPERRELWQGLVLDCQRLVAEWYRKKKPEYFEPARHVFDAESQEFFSHGLSIRQMTENALVPLSDNPEEEARRVNERVEDATPHMIRRLGKVAIGRETIRTISECTDKAIQEFAEDQKQGNNHHGYNGYVPEIEKVMVRDIKLDTKTNDRFEEQVGLPGIYITHEIIQMALQTKGVAAANMGKTELHGSQLLVADDLMEFVELLDTVASEQWCVNVFMGEPVESDFKKDYAGFRNEAQQRQKGLKELAEGVAYFVLDLAETKTDRLKAPALVEDFVKLQLLQLGKQDFAVAEQMFDTKTARSLQIIARLEQQGLYEQATEQMARVAESAPGGGFCGAGSCGLEAVAFSDSNGLKATELGLKDGKLLHSKELACPNCHEKTIYFDRKNKACVKCDFRRINGVTIKGKKKEELSVAPTKG